ncbi:uncharacterized protein LOC110753103 [Prunus avium]|uniref:Uncharacterized protein LOC110753103 n=1 Tax=Prunus avium TaxID=42229 RepID=A0A6P5S4Q6_PRUAV|nr:uncharacterized protein LOC110753103 [Prunus avium]
MIMDSRVSLASQESTIGIKMISARRRPLHTCAVSILVISHRAFTIAQGFNGPLGFIIKFAARVATLGGPLAYALQYQWITMAILSFIDNRILALEDMVERFYPPSHIVFNKIDDLVRVTETLPGKFDNVISKIPGCVSHVSFLDWTLVRAISLLNFVVASLSYWRMSKGTKEKEIKVDTSSKVERNNEPGFVHEADQPKEPLTLSNNNNYNNKNKCADGDQIDKGNIMSPRHVGVTKGATYKEVLLQKATNKAGVEKKEEKNINNKEEVESSIADDDDESETDSKDDGLLELFESAWLMTSPGRNASRNYTPRSVSFTY